PVMARSGARIAAGTSHHGWPRAAKAISVPARRTRPSRMSHRRGAPGTTPPAAGTVPCRGGGAGVKPGTPRPAPARRRRPGGAGPSGLHLAAWLGHAAAARQGPDQGADEAVEADTGRNAHGFPLAGVVGEDVDAGVAFGQVDHAAAVDQDVFGLVDELGRDGA